MGGGQSVKLFYFRNISINENNQLDITVKRAVKPFENFEDYHLRLLTAMRETYENAKDEHRKYKYGIVTTISKGYDAPCCAVIAKEIGCTTAVTFKAEGKYKEDSGVEIAQVLGYSNIIEKDALAYKNRSDMVETEFLCSGELGAHISFCAFDEEYRGNLVFTGDRGDSIWSRSSVHRNNHFYFIDVLSHLGNSERRLWVGFISVPMPLFGASAWESIYDISNSEEMKPWMLYNDYDRPIPRRICEEKGVPRNAFGIAKHGAGFIYRYDSLKRIKSRMSTVSAHSFEEYVRKNRKYNLFEMIAYFWKAKSIYWFALLNKLGLKGKQVNLEKLSKIANPMSVRYLIPWAGEIITSRYKDLTKE